MADKPKKENESDSEHRARIDRSKAAKRINRATGLKHTTALRRLEAGESEQAIVDSSTEEV